MAEKDIVEKSLESYNDVFADIVNGLLFNGQKIIKENELEAESEHSIYKADDKLHEQVRDVAKYWKNGMTTVIKKLVESGAMTVEQIAGVLQLPVEKVKELAEMKLPE
ncbi:MAG: hypothetical protein K6F69_00315 [Treponema sp.]|nr:hypothetical protein [Treponema sp.]